MVRGSDPQDLWLELDVDLDQLEVMGAPMEEAQVTTAMINALCEDYAMAKQFLASTEDVTREQVERLARHRYAELRRVETDGNLNRTGALSEHDSARRNGHKGRGRGGQQAGTTASIKCFKCGMPGHTRSTCSFPGKCRACGKLSHAEKACRTGKTDGGHQVNPSSIPFGVGLGAIALEGHTKDSRHGYQQSGGFVGAARTVRVFAEEEWVCDSGASHHMTGDARGLRDYKRVSGKVIGVATGEKTSIEGFGTLNLDFPLADKTLLNIELKSVAYVPKL
ncbi:unnamed protein product, partial [Discosporangium mesarthrocarpum]